jgi:Glycosyltransferase
MEAKSNLHIVICSQLYRHGGGCETWLNYFLEGTLNSKEFAHIHIYHIAPQFAEQSIVGRFSIYKNCSFYSCQVESTQAGNGLRNIFCFSWFALKQLKQTVGVHDKIIMVGSTYVAPVGILLRLLKGRSFTLMTWLRSIAVGEMGARESKFVKIAHTLEKYLLLLSDKIIANGKDTKAYYCCHMPKITDRVYVIPNAVDNKYYDDAGLPDFSKNISIAFLGRMIRAKGFLTYLHAIDFLYRKNKDLSIQFHIYGHGNSEVSSNSHLVMHGPFSPDQSKEILTQHQVIVFLNLSNLAGGVSHGLLEAMAAGRVIVAWDNEIHNQVLNQENAILIKEGDVEALSTCFEKLGKLDNLGKMIILNKCTQARETARQYSVEMHIKRFMSILEE